MRTILAVDGGGSSVHQRPGDVPAGRSDFQHGGALGHERDRLQMGLAEHPGDSCCVTRHEAAMLVRQLG